MSFEQFSDFKKKKKNFSLKQTCFTRYLTGLIPPPVPQMLSSRTIPCFLLRRSSALSNAACLCSSSTVPLNFITYLGAMQSSAIALAINCPITLKYQ